MSTRFHHILALLALSAACAFAQAQTPTRAGRISLAQGQVSIGGELGDEAEPAVLNWPVTARNQITTGRDSRTEIKVGSTAVRLDANSALDVVELDDDTLRLHLHYGSATIRLRNPDQVNGFEMSTPQGTVRMSAAGRMRVDAGRIQDTSMVSVFEGVAVVDGGGSRMNVRAGKRVELTPDDVRTGLAMRESFDEWAMLRDERDDRSESVRYVSSEMTGYEDLDQNGVWRDDREYGPLWSPRSTPVGWAPYRDGRWAYVQPWGWTWIDNAPWGYAPFHYGRWVMVHNRWCWTPGRSVSRVVWSPALVGWIGGSNWSLAFNSRGTHSAAPAQGWYPLSPRDTYVPTYRVDHERLRHLNRYSGDVRDDVRGRNRRHDDNQRLGMTILPHEQFNQRRSIEVRNSPQAIVSASSMLAAPTANAPVAPQAVRERRRDERNDNRADNRGDHRGDGRGDNRNEARMAPDPRRFEREGGNGIARGERVAVPAPAAMQAVPAQPRPATVITAPSAPVSPAATIFRNDGRQTRDERRPRMETPSHMPTPAPAMPPVQASPIQVQSGVAISQPAPQRDERANRFERVEAERERRPRDGDADRERRASFQPVPVPVQRQAPQMQVQQAPVQQQQQVQVQRMPAPQPQPQQQVQQAPMARAAPVQAAPAAAAPPPAAARDDKNERRRGGREENANLR
jgi:hypothetical protein